MTAESNTRLSGFLFSYINTFGTNSICLIYAVSERNYETGQAPKINAFLNGIQLPMYHRNTLRHS